MRTQTATRLATAGALTLCAIVASATGVHGNSKDEFTDADDAIVLPGQKREKGWTRRLKQAQTDQTKLIHDGAEALGARPTGGKNGTPLAIPILAANGKPFRTVPEAIERLLHDAKQIGEKHAGQKELAIDAKTSVIIRNRIYPNMVTAVASKEGITEVAVTTGPFGQMLTPRVKKPGQSWGSPSKYQLRLVEARKLSRQSRAK